MESPAQQCPRSRNGFRFHQAEKIHPHVQQIGIGERRDRLTLFTAGALDPQALLSRPDNHRLDVAVRFTVLAPAEAEKNVTR